MCEKERRAAPSSNYKLKVTPRVFTGIAGLPGPAAEERSKSIVSLLGEI